MHEFADGSIRMAVADQCGTITLNRPEKKNAINDAMLEGMEQALGLARADDEVRVIVVQGAGEVFSSGRDTKAFGAPAALDDGSLEAVQQGFLRVLAALDDSPKPTIASVSGYAMGAGQAMTLACDFVVADRSARFGNVEMAYGFPAAMNIVLLARHLGRRMGLEIAMTGETYTAERYYELGLVNRLAEPGQLAQCTAGFAGLLASRAPWAVSRTKATFRMAEDSSMQGGLHLGSQLNQLLMLASQSKPVHSGDATARAALKRHLDDS